LKSIRLRDAVPLLLLASVIGCSAYVRFYDAWTSPAPGLSDGYVTLAWMKYVNSRDLFHDGIYPQGFHIFLAYLKKFAAIDSLYVLKYTGPLNGVLICAGLYFTISRFGGNRYAGIAAAALYGLGGTSLHGADWVRQAATNSQEFALVFVFPTFYFMVRYLQEGRRQDLLTALAGCAVTGLVHTLVFAFTGLGVGVLLVVGLLLHPRLLWKRMSRLAAGALATVVLSVLPLGLGYALGKKVHSSSEEFLVSQAKVTPPDLTGWDVAALCALAILFLAALLILFARRPAADKIAVWFAALLGAGTFALYEFGGTVTQSLVLASRSGALWVPALSFCIGAAGCVIARVPLPSVLRDGMQAASILLLGAWLVTLTHLTPIVPYKMEWEANVEQYLRIADERRPNTWIIFSQNEEYALSLGVGYHDYIKMLVETYDPTRPPLTRRGAAEPDPNVPKHIYIFQEKKVFRVAKDNAIYSLLESVYEQREQDNKKLDKWLESYRKWNGDVEVFYEDDHLVVYHLQRLDERVQDAEKIWGNSW
jgi:hypothetical protein